MKGELGWPPLALFRVMLWATWHDLSDVRLAEALDDRASFLRFCGFAAHEPMPERAAFFRFRRILIRCGLNPVLFQAVNRQHEAKGIMVRASTLVNPTLFPSASIRDDGEARRVGHLRRKPGHCYRVHATIDEGAGLVPGVSSPRLTFTMRPSLRRRCRASRGRFAATMLSAARILPMRPA